jgi:lysozyme
MTEELVAAVKRFEGLRLEPYMCPAGYPTIGYGHRCSSLAVPAITAAEADALLRDDLARAELHALALAPNLADHPRRLAALTDLVFNVGPGPLRGAGVVRALRANDWQDAARRFRQWNKARDPITGELAPLPGLTIRRETGARWIEEGP